MKVSDVILGPIVALIGAIALIASSMQPKPFFGGSYGGGFFPSIISVALIAAGGLLTLESIRSKSLRPLLQMGPWVHSPRHIANGGVVLGSLVFYILFSESLGFIIISVIVVFATLLQFTRAPLSSLIVALVATAVVKIGFQDLLLVPLPWGLLEPYAGVLTWK